MQSSMMFRWQPKNIKPCCDHAASLKPQQLHNDELPTLWWSLRSAYWFMTVLADAQPSDSIWPALEKCCAVENEISHAHVLSKIDESHLDTKLYDVRWHPKICKPCCDLAASLRSRTHRNDERPRWLGCLWYALCFGFMIESSSTIVHTVWLSKLTNDVWWYLKLMYAQKTATTQARTQARDTRNETTIIKCTNKQTDLAWSARHNGQCNENDSKGVAANRQPRKAIRLGRARSLIMWPNRNFLKLMSTQESEVCPKIWLDV